MVEELDKRLTLRLSNDLSVQLQEYAKKHNQSMNSAILSAIELLLSPKKKDNRLENFEQRNLLGQIVNSRDIDQNTGIITVRGLVYRYLTENNSAVTSGKNYQVININGNVLIIKESEQ